MQGHNSQSQRGNLKSHQTDDNSDSMLTGQWKISHDLFSSPNIGEGVKSRGIGEKRGTYRVSVRNLEERDHLEDPDVDESKY